MLSAKRDSELFDDPKWMSLFYAQSWLLAHRLVVGKAFSGNLAQRLDAFQAPEVLTDLPERMPQKLPVEILPAAVPTTPEAATVRELAAWEYEHRLAELLRAQNRTAQARQALTSLRTRFPDRPEPADSLGALEMDELQYDRAETWLSEAVRLGSINPASHYRYSLLLMRPSPPVRPEERMAQAAWHAQRAVELNPDQPLYWLARAQAEMQLSEWEAARSSLAHMRERTADPLLQEQVRVELEEIDRRREQQVRPPLRPRPPAPPPPVAASAEPPPPPSISPAPAPAKPVDRPYPGTLTFWGYVRRVDCSEDGKIVTVSNRRFSIRVRERPGSPAKLYSPPRKWQRIPCALKDIEVNVVYRPAANFGPLNGDLVAVIF